MKGTCTSVANYAIALVVFSDNVVLFIGFSQIEFLDVCSVFHFALG